MQVGAMSRTKIYFVMPDSVKRLIVLKSGLLFLLISTVLYSDLGAQDMSADRDFYWNSCIGIIDDPDGYVNVRKHDRNSQVTGRI